MFGAVGDTPYRIVLVLHILSILVAFAPAFTHPLVVQQTQDLPDEASRRRLIGLLAGNGRRIYGPALIVAGIFGFALSGMSGGIYALSQGWLIASIIIWIAMNGLIHAVLVPAERAMAEGDDAARVRYDRAGPLTGILLLLMVVLMIFKPGA